MGCMSARHRLVVCLSRRVSISLNTLNVEGNLLISTAKIPRLLIIHRPSKAPQLPKSMLWEEQSMTGEGTANTQPARPRKHRPLHEMAITDGTSLPSPASSFTLFTIQIIQ